MKKLFFAIVAMFLLMGVNSNVIAQNPVKKVKYLKHVFEGEVNKKVPEGKGTMFFDGFTVQGDFQGNEVTNATLSIDNSDITYNGNLSFDESQNVTLKHGGEIKTFLYAKYYTDRYQGYTEISKYTPYVIETISTDKNVSINFFNKSELDFQYTVSVDWKDEIKKFLNPPVITQTFHKTAMPIKVRYRFNNFEEKYEIIELDDESFDPIEWKLKTIYFLDFLEDVPQKNLRNVVGYKDEENRVWSVKVDEENDMYDTSKVLYPNGSFICGRFTKPDPTNEWRYEFKLIRSDNTVITSINNSGIIIGDTCYFYNSDKIKIASCPIEHSCELKDIIETMDTTHLLDYYPNDFVPVIYNCKTLTEKDIENILKNTISPKFKKLENGKLETCATNCFRVTNETSKFLDPSSLPSHLKHLEGKHFLLISDGEEIIGYYCTEDEVYLPVNQIAESFQTEVREKLYAELDMFNKRFGFNPKTKSINNLIVPGLSYDLLVDYFDFMQRGFKTFYIPKDGTNTERFFDTYYYLKLDYRGENSTSYYLYSSLGRSYTSEGYKLATVWIRNGKVSSVQWHKIR